MPELSTLIVFAASTLAILALPGPSVLFVVARSLEHGRSAGLVSVLGVETGALLHVGAAAVGLSAVIASSDLAFALIKYGGAAYLLALGVRALRTRDAAIALGGASSRARLFLQGVLVDALNPKTALFFIAFLPQFVDPDRGSVATQIAVLGLCFVALAALTDGLYAAAAGSFADRLRRSAAARRRLAGVSGAAYLGLGVVAAL